MTEAKLDVLDVFSWVDLMYSVPDDGEKLQWLDFEFTEMETVNDKRPSYPSSKLTFNIANITKGKTIHIFNINLYNLNGLFDVDIIFEDSQRNFLSSFN